jgi:Spy/CpxP family protein refolding chaperone
MKTKHYLLVSGAVIIGIIAGVIISTGIMKRQHMKMTYAQSEMQRDGNDCGKFQRMGKGKKSQGMQMRNMDDKNNMGNQFRMHKNFIDQLDLTEDQQNQMDEIMTNMDEERKQMKNVREARWAATQVEIKSVLNEDQIEKMEEISEAGGPPKIQRILKQLDLSVEQEEKIEQIWDRNQEMSKGMQEARQQKQEENFEKINAILTAEQLQQLEDFKADHPRRGKGKGMGRKGRM